MGLIETKLEHVGAAIALEAERTRIAMQAGLETTLRGLRVGGAQHMTVRPNRVNYNGSGRLVGWSIRAVGGDATITLHDGRTADDEPVATIALAAGASSNHTIMPAGVSFVEALYAEVTSTGAGTITGALWIGAVD